jgi:branched-chain amino acid transport system substrate-binding protein
MKFRIYLTTCLSAILCVAGIALAQQTPKSTEPLIIGIAHSSRYPYATMMKQSFEMSLEIINHSGGINGRPLELVYADDRGERTPGQRVVKELVKKHGAVMLVGAYHSSNAVYMAGVADKLDVPLLVCTAADDRITQRKWKNVYRLNAPASEYTTGLEDFFLKKIKPKSMAIVYENSAYGTGGALRMMWFCRENDIDLRAIIPYHKERLKTEYFQKILAPLKENPTDIVYMVSYLNDAALLVKNIRELRINSLLCGGAGGFTHQKFIQKTGPYAELLLTATLWTHELNFPGTKYYYEQYVQKYAIAPDYHGAEAYTALLVAADALKRATSFDPGSIRRALDQTDMITPFGPVKFVSYGKFERQNSLPTQVLQVIDTKFECVWPQKLATSPFVEPPGYRVLE